MEATGSLNDSLAFRHINFQGIYRFPLERYLDRLLPSSIPGQKIAGGAK
jgi:hypothetical protein